VLPGIAALILAISPIDAAHALDAPEDGIGRVRSALHVLRITPDLEEIPCRDGGQASRRPQDASDGPTPGPSPYTGPFPPMEATASTSLTSRIAPGTALTALTSGILPGTARIPGSEECRNIHPPVPGNAAGVATIVTAPYCYIDAPLPDSARSNGARRESERDVFVKC
jgi:hypothetical protein